MNAKNLQNSTMTAFKRYNQSEFNYAEARHGKGLEGLLKRYFK